MSGLGDKFKGTVKETVGKATGNDKLEAKGKAEQIVGNVKDALGEKVNKVLDKAKDKTSDDSK